MWCYATHPLAKIRKERMLTMFRGRGRPKQRESSKLMLLMVVTQLGLTGGFSSRAIRRKERLGGDTNVKRFYFKIRLHERSKKRQRIPLYMEPHFVPVTNSSQSRQTVRAASQWRTCLNSKSFIQETFHLLLTSMLAFNGPLVDEVPHQRARKTPELTFSQLFVSTN